MCDLLVYIPGTPRSKGNHRVSRGGGVYETTKESGRWELAARNATALALGELDERGSIYQPDESKLVLCTLVFERPRKHFSRAGLLREDAPQYHSVKPDPDKVLRNVLDGLKKGGAFTDDARVSSVAVRKLYSVHVGTDGLEYHRVGATVQVLRAMSHHKHIETMFQPANDAESIWDT